jgi:hypothetical protein
MTNIFGILETSYEVLDTSHILVFSSTAKAKGLKLDLTQIFLPSDEERDLTPLQMLLESAGLLDWIKVFNKEQIDLDALVLLTENDMAKLGLPLGPRKKLLKALHDRKNAIDNPGDFRDTKI